ncbi:hypothetical protein [Clostridium butyricum]|uniref:Uncharacterized protein n=1 Tax=Clostridium butyricum E4 str. BoNT E BL5262 TaxID=632245 RepID=C4IK92_CLOBU|nr:hypothetical protein [Clostridium butyricum]APF22928.1 hypothetical protein NPD4_2674 [Clostridium butyricum]EDT75107.1 hypothetical protein CBY_3265 [Clostridium butyricum 5521]EEP53417.1 hypothetical protein CLP_1275 [Clostridium butyricum E4 str. BoNT E BL5262]NFL33425.1 hypothetical protein [Clostridium butyricum]NFS20499.1 hypothetical protein [Clostridium butyricum]
MSKVSLALLKQRSAAVESCVSEIENMSINKYGEQTEVAEGLRNNWDLLYSMVLDLHENIQDFMGEVKE